MARQSLSPMKEFNYEQNKEAMAYDTLPRRKTGCSISHLKYLRKKNGYTLETLSQITSISISYLSRLESGSRRLNTDLIHRLACAFGCDPAELLNESNHDRLMGNADSIRHRGEIGYRDGRAMPLYYITKSEDDPNKLVIKITPPAEWKLCPTEFNERERVIALRAEEYFLPHFSKSTTLYLETATALVPESTVVILNSGEVQIKKVWSVTPNSLQLCNLSDMEKMKKGEPVDSLISVNENSIDFMYKVVGYSDFDVQ